MTIKEQLDKLFEEWIQFIDPDKFCRDGLVMKYRETQGNTIEEKWSNAERRIAFLLKDNPDGGTDLRTWLSEEGENYEQNRSLCGGKVGQTGFLPNIARMFYGLYANPCVGFDELNMAEVKKVWNEAPFALIECKKAAGTKNCPPKELRNSINNKKNKENLEKELNILKPNIIVCCDPDDIIFKFVTDYYSSINEGSSIVKHEYKYTIKDEIVQKMKNCSAWYFEKARVLVIKSYHPTSKGKPNWKIYERAVSPLRTFPKKEDLDFKPINII